MATVEGYTDLAEIGRGGFATVYRAVEIGSGHAVALKVITASLLARDGQDRFEQEVRAMRRLSGHPNVVTIYGAGVTPDDAPYLVMEYATGGSAAGVLERSGPLAPEEVASIGAQMAAALAAAHEAALTHRDVKPENILLDDRGTALLSDFGIASIAGASLRTATGLFLGSLLHSAPECLAGERANAASDVYSLGSTMYELLTGTAAFASLAEESLAAIIVQGPTADVPDLAAQGVPDTLAMIVHAAMDKDPARRPTAARLGRALELCDPRNVPATGDVQQTIGIVLGGTPPAARQDSLNIVLRSSSTPPPPASGLAPPPARPASGLAPPPAAPADPARATIAYQRPAAPPAPGASATPDPGLPFVPTASPKRRLGPILLLAAVVIAVLVLVVLALG